MSDYKITLACRHYDGTNAILRGVFRPPGVDLRVIESQDVASMFRGFFKGEYDVSEMSLSELIFYTSRGISDFIGIPVFPVRWFRHGFMLCNRSAPIRSPEDLSGKKIGFMRWVQTAAIWVRGMLVEHYGVSPKLTRWYVASMHHWDEDGQDHAVKPRDGSEICWLQNRGGAELAKDAAYEGLKAGDIDVLCTTESPDVLMRKDPTIRRVFENYDDIERAYFKKTRILPIMHVLAIRKSVVDEHPDLPVKLFELFSEAKKWARQWVRSHSSLCIAWKDRYLEHEAEAFQCDPWAYGLKPNQHIIDTFLSYCYEQGVSERKLVSKDLFAPATWELEEE